MYIEILEHLQIFKNKHFLVEHCFNCQIPGYLIVSPLIQVRLLSNMGQKSLSELGPTLALATQAIEVVLKPDRIYCTAFGEENNLLHFHLFPRTKRILEEFLKENPGASRAISSPLIIGWSRIKYQSDSKTMIKNPDIIETIENLRKYIRSV